MAITFWRNVQRKITTQEMDASFDTLVNDIANAGISSEMPEGTIYIGDNTNTASLETLDTSIVPETTDKRYQSDLQDTYNDATSSIQGQLDDKLDLDGGNANQDIDIGNYSLNAKHVKINGTAGSGHLGLKHQSANITASASESSIGANSVGNPVWKNDGNAIDEIELISRKTNTVTGNETSTTKYLSVKGIYDWAVGLFAPIASPTFTGTVTTPDLLVSGATASTIAHFDASKNVESLPTATYPNLTELSYVKGVTSAIQTQIDAKTNSYTIPNYYRVDLNLGDDLTGVAGREDKPYKLIQTVWDLIPTSSTAQITIEIVGDYTFTTHALLTSVAKDNITFLFKGKIVYSVPSATGSRPLFTFSGSNNNLTFIIPNYSQTTQGGFISTITSSGHRYVIDNMQILLGVNTTTVNNYGFYSAGASNEGYFQCNNLTISLTGDGNGLKGYSFPINLKNINYRINSLKITGTASVASTAFYCFSSSIKSIYIENLITDNTYTNISQYGFGYALSCDNVFINNINVGTGGLVAINYNNFLFQGTIKNLTIMSGSINNYSIITSETTGIENINLGNLSINGMIHYTSSSGGFLKNINLLGNITRTATLDCFAFLGNGATLNGNGFKIFHNNPTYSAGIAIFLIYGATGGKTVSFNNLTIYNTNMATGSTQAFVPIMYVNSLGNVIRCRNLVVSSNIDNNTHSNTSWIRPFGGDTSYVCRVEGNVATNYLQNVTNLTNDTDTDLINGYRF